MIPVGTTFDGLVLNDDPTLPTTWFWHRDDIVLLRTFSADSIDIGSLHDDLQAVLQNLRGPGVQFRVTSSPLHLFDSAYAGSEAHHAPGRLEERLPALTIPCASGTFDVRTAPLETADGDALVHWLVPKRSHRGA